LGLLYWIEEKARKKMRFSHIKLLYQNLFASMYLIENFERAPTEAETLENLKQIQERTQAFMAELPDDDMLKIAASDAVFADNKSLKKTYAALASAPKIAASEDAIDFAEKFKPSAGWKAFSDADWAELVNRLGAA